LGKRRAPPWGQPRIEHTASHRPIAAQTNPQIAPNELRSVTPKCRPSRLRVRSPRSDSPSARGRRGLVRERRDSVLATDLAHHRHKADGVGTAGTQKPSSISHKERTTHQSHSRWRRSVTPICHHRATRAIHQDPTLLAGVSESDRWLAAAPPRAYPLSRKTTSGELHPGGRGRGLGGGRNGRARGDEPPGLSTRCVSILNNASSGPPTTSTNTRPEGAASVSPIARSRTPHGVQLVFGGRSSGGVASLDPRLISVIPTGIAGRDFVTPHDRTLFPRHPVAAAPPRAGPLSRETTSGQLHPGGRGRGSG
jgi:hypothetical protein